jgi:hypothetical protein
MKDPTPRRLGGIASDLARLSNLAHSPGRDLVAFHDVLTEVKLFTEWTAPDVSLATQKKILALQRALVGWGVRDLPGKRFSSIEQNAEKWSREILKISGLI